LFEDFIQKEVKVVYSVYVHENKTNGKRYVGITSCDVQIRWKRGFGYSDSLPIGRAIRKYGWDGFEHIIVASGLTETEAKEMEIALIREWQTQSDEFGYNITAGGNGVTGWHPSKETRTKISTAAKKRIGDLNSNYGHTWTDEMRQRAAESKKRENLSVETLRKMSEAAKDRFGEKNPFYGKHHSEATRAMLAQRRYRAVEAFDMDGNKVFDFQSIKEAAEKTGINKVAISNCCRGVTNTSGGYRWQYKSNK
jgi:group I intron endonuclease